MAAFSAMFSANEVLPIQGRPAMMMRSLRWKPAVSLSRSSKPDGTPVTNALRSDELLDVLDVGIIRSFIATKPGARAGR